MMLVDSPFRISQSQLGNTAAFACVDWPFELS